VIQEGATYRTILEALRVEYSQMAGIAHFVEYDCQNVTIALAGLSTSWHEQGFRDCQVGLKALNRHLAVSVVKPANPAMKEVVSPGASLTGDIPKLIGQSATAIVDPRVLAHNLA